MRRTVACLLVVFCGYVSVACGSEPPAGTGFLVAADLRPVTPPRFTAPPRPMRAQLVVRDNGCVTVSIEGAQHLPIWPDGTKVADSAADPGHYTVTLSTGTTLEATAAGGSAFEASGVIDDVRGPFNDAQGLPGKVQQLLDFCGAPGEPVLFPDAATFTRT
jgi:hypothetical protein